jgi:hypothetical protein
MRLMVDGTPHKLATCESFYLASHIPHGVETIENTRVQDTRRSCSPGNTL